MMTEDASLVAEYVSFQGTRRLTVGALADVAVAARLATDHHPDEAVIIFDRTTGKGIDLNLSGSEADIVARYALPVPAAAGRGRPKLGVVAREVTLLPRHWEWLAKQPGGASVTLRKLIEAARKTEGMAGDLRARTAAAYGFMVTMAGDLAGFEEASRALFAGDRVRLEGLMAPWPKDVRDEVVTFLDA